METGRLIETYRYLVIAAFEQVASLQDRLLAILVYVN